DDPDRELPVDGVDHRRGRSVDGDVVLAVLPVVDEPARLAVRPLSAVRRAARVRTACGRRSVRGARAGPRTARSPVRERMRTAAAGTPARPEPSRRGRSPPP